MKLTSPAVLQTASRAQCWPDCCHHFPCEGRGENVNSHLFGNFQMFLSKVHGLLMIPQGGVGIS